MVYFTDTIQLTILANVELWQIKENLKEIFVGFGVFVEWILFKMLKRVTLEGKIYSHYNRSDELKVSKIVIVKLSFQLLDGHILSQSAYSR